MSAPPIVDHGAILSLRELGTDPGNHNYFQNRDVVKYSTILERRVFAEVLDFLEDQQVDTSEYRARAQTIINNGVVSYGTNASFSGIGTNATGGTITNATTAGK